MDRNPCHRCFAESGLEGLASWAGALLIVGFCLASCEPCAGGVPPAADPLGTIVSAMYNAEYASAEPMLREWVKEHPEDIRAWNYLAEAILDEEMLREGLYSGAAYANSGIAFRKREQPVSAGFKPKLEVILDQAQKLETGRLKRNPRDEEAMYWLGVTDSTRTEFEFAINRSYLAALREGKRAWKLNERLLAMDPHFTDAYFVIGLGDYAAGVLPWYFRVVASIAGVHGSRSQGIEELKRASSEGHYTQVDARIVLVAVYEREKQFPQALALLRQLNQEFPWNYLAPLEIARIDRLQGNWRQAAEVDDAAVERFVHGKQDPSHAPRAAILLQAGEAHERLGEFEKALDLYREAGKQPGPSTAVYRSDLAAARLDQRLHHLAEAKREYQTVVDGVPDTDLADEARRALADLR
ncbi:MAG: tetratricopeptide repeat protein [Terriglobia bacterium]